MQESRHRLARKIFHRQHGKLCHFYHEGQQDALGALVWSSAPSTVEHRYIDAAVNCLRADGHPVRASSVVSDTRLAGAPTGREPATAKKIARFEPRRKIGHIQPDVAELNRVPKP